MVTVERVPNAVQPPAARPDGATFSCPRCDARLFTEDWDLVCVMCGYAYEIVRYATFRYPATAAEGQPVRPASAPGESRRARAGSR